MYDGLSAISGMYNYGMAGNSALSGMYGNPMMSMMGGIGSPYGMGMMGMMNPDYIKQMYNTQFEVEKAMLNNATQMHDLTTQAEVEHLSAHDRALFEKAMVDGDVQCGIRNLGDVIRTGDQDAICIEYDKLKQTIYTKYSDYFQNNGNKMNTKANVDNLISMIYGQVYTKQNGGVPVDLRTDIKKYGETAFMHGCNQTFLGKQDYHDNYSEETLSYLFGTRIDNKGGKDRMEKAGGYLARGAEGLAALGVGYAGGVAARSVVKAFAPKFLSNFGSKIVKNHSKNWFVKQGQKLSQFGTWGKIGALAALTGDVVWQMSR